MTQKTYTPSELTLIIKSFERQASIMLKLIILLAIINVIFVCLCITHPTNVSINLTKDDVVLPPD